MFCFVDSLRLILFDGLIQFLLFLLLLFVCLFWGLICLFWFDACGLIFCLPGSVGSVYVV